jgi:hypothetical protein
MGTARTQGIAQDEKSAQKHGQYTTSHSQGQGLAGTRRQPEGPDPNTGASLPHEQETADSVYIPGTYEGAPAATQRTTGNPATRDTL